MSAEEVGFGLVGVAMVLLAYGQWGWAVVIYMTLFGLFCGGISVWFAQDRIVKMILDRLEGDVDED